MYNTYILNATLSMVNFFRANLIVGHKVTKIAKVLKFIFCIWRCFIPPLPLATIVHLCSSNYSNEIKFFEQDGFNLGLSSVVFALC